jgi:hypothetical protein
MAGFLLTIILGGRARVNEFKFHDLHHAFPNKVGALSMRGRFNDWHDVYDGGMRILEHGIFEHLAKDKHDEYNLASSEFKADAQSPNKESTISQMQRRRSTVYKAEMKSGAIHTQRKSFIYKASNVLTVGNVDKKATGTGLAEPLLS